MKKTVCISVCLTVLIVSLPAILVTVGWPAEKPTVDIGYKKHVAYMPLFVAQELGYFEQEGLSANPVVFDSTNQMMVAIISGNIDAALGGANLQTIYSIEEKSPNSIKVSQTLDVDETTGITCVMVKSDSDIDSMLELEGKQCATLPGTFSPIWIDAALKTVGIGKEDIKIQSLSTKLQLPALESNQIDALFTVEPACSFGVNKGIGKIVYNEPLRHLGSSLTASAVSAKLVEESPEVAESIVRVADRAIDFIRSNPQESMQIMAKYTGYNPESIAGMKAPTYSKSNEIDSGDLQALADILYVEGNLESHLDVNGLIYK